LRKIFVENVARLAAFGLCFDLCVLARQLPIAFNLASKCPHVSFVLDHCGVPDVRNQVLDPWRAHIRELSSLPNVSCKLSGIVAYAHPENWQIEDLRPFVDHVIESFGWDRVMFGSDWPVCNLTASYQRWVATVLSLTHTAGEANQRKLFHANAIRIYRLS
jgi:predicted TIM-barrel fold metal-dependent hydrolase